MVLEVIIMGRGRPHKCPYCEATSSVAKGFRYNKGEKVRLRRCKVCKRRWTVGPVHGDGPSAAGQTVGIQPCSEAVVLDTGMRASETGPPEDGRSGHHSELSTVTEDDASEYRPEKEKDEPPDGNAQM